MFVCFVRNVFVWFALFEVVCVCVFSVLFDVLCVSVCYGVVLCGLFLLYFMCLIVLFVIVFVFGCVYLCCVFFFWSPLDSSQLE